MHYNIVITSVKNYCHSMIYANQLISVWLSFLHSYTVQCVKQQLNDPLYCDPQFDDVKK